MEIQLGVTIEAPVERVWEVWQNNPPEGASIEESWTGDLSLTVGHLGKEFHANFEVIEEINYNKLVTRAIYQQVEVVTLHEFVCLTPSRTRWTVQSQSSFKNIVCNREIENRNKEALRQYLRHIKLLAEDKTKI